MNYQIKTIYLIGTEDYWGNAKHNMFYTGLYADSQEEAKKNIEEKYNKIGVIKPVLAINVDNNVFILKDGQKMCNINDVQPKNDVQLISCLVGNTVHFLNTVEHNANSGKTTVLISNELSIYDENSEILYQI